MVHPKRSDIAIIQAMKRNKEDKKEIPRYDEETEYKCLLWDSEHKQLPLSKQDRFRELELKYGNKQNF